MGNVGQSLLRSGDPISAMAHSVDALSVMAQLGLNHTFTFASATVDVGIALKELGRLQQSLEVLEEGTALMRRLFPAGHMAMERPLSYKAQVTARLGVQGAHRGGGGGQVEGVISVAGGGASHI